MELCIQYAECCEKFIIDEIYSKERFFEEFGEIVEKYCRFIVEQEAGDEQALLVFQRLLKVTNVFEIYYEMPEIQGIAISRYYDLIQYYVSLEKEEYVDLIVRLYRDFIEVGKEFSWYALATSNYDAKDFENMLLITKDVSMITKAVNEELAEILFELSGFAMAPYNLNAGNPIFDKIGKAHEQISKNV